MGGLNICQQASLGPRGYTLRPYRFWHHIRVIAVVDFGGGSGSVGQSDIWQQVSRHIAERILPVLVLG